MGCFDCLRKPLACAFAFRALTPVRWVELCPSSGQLRPDLYKFLGCPHASDYAADAFLVANPVVLGPCGAAVSFVAFMLCIPAPLRNRQQIESCLAQARQKVQLVTKPWIA